LHVWWYWTPRKSLKKARTSAGSAGRLWDRGSISLDAMGSIGSPESQSSNQGKTPNSVLIPLKMRLKSLAAGRRTARRPPGSAPVRCWGKPRPPQRNSHERAGYVYLSRACHGRPRTARSFFENLLKIGFVRSFPRPRPEKPRSLNGPARATCHKLASLVHFSTAQLPPCHRLRLADDFLPQVPGVERPLSAAGGCRAGVDWLARGQREYHSGAWQNPCAGRRLPACELHASGHELCKLQLDEKRPSHWYAHAGMNQPSSPRAGPSANRFPVSAGRQQ